MFSNEIIVKGNFVSGTIKKNDGNKESSHHPYILHSGLNLGSQGGITWTSEKLKEVSKEILEVAAEMDKQNKVGEAEALVYQVADFWRIKYNAQEKLCCPDKGKTFAEIIEVLSLEGWKYRWTHANGLDHYFYKETKQ